MHRKAKARWSSNHAFHRYRRFKIKKKSGGFRQITAARNKSFMILLQSVNEMLKALYTPSDYVMGDRKTFQIIIYADVITACKASFRRMTKD